MDQDRAARLAHEGLDIWEAGRAEAAAQRYIEAVAHADPAHYATPSYHEQLAGALAALGFEQDALRHFREAVALERQQGPDDSGARVAVARYFLAEQHAKIGQPLDALAALEQSLRVENRAEPLLRLVQAECLWSLGRIEDARVSARRAVAVAVSDEQRGRIRERLAHVLAESVDAEDPEERRGQGPV